MTTAIIKRPNTYPPPHVLECDGPLARPVVNRIPGTNIGFSLPFEELLLHQKETEKHPESIDYDSACRIARLIDATERNDSLSIKHLKEIRWRMELLYPCCTGDSCRPVKLDPCY